MTFISDNIPSAVKGLVMMNELDLACTKTLLQVHQNITKDEQNVLKSQLENKKIVIKKVDKGSGIVIRDIEKYIAEDNVNYQIAILCRNKR